MTVYPQQGAFINARNYFYTNFIYNINCFFFHFSHGDSEREKKRMTAAKN